LPYLWSVEGAARLIRGVLGKSKGIPKIEIKKSGYKLIVDKSVKDVRPFITGFVAKGCKVDDYLIKQIIQLQEKLCESFGRKRKKAAIGVYAYDKIKFPVKYKATAPESIKFTPLDFFKEMTQQEILEEHPTGKKYAGILENAKKYPILVDKNDEVLSFPPIINSNNTGKVEVGSENLFFEVTGTDLQTVLTSANIFAQAFYDRGFQIFSVDVDYSGKKMTTPVIRKETMKLDKERVKKFTGLDLKDAEIKKLLEKAQFNYNNGKVEIPHYRQDILHDVDLIEEIAIMFDFNKIPVQPLSSYTIGGTSEIQEFIDVARTVIVGAGYQEMMSPMLTNKESLFNKMNVKPFGVIEIEEFMSESFSVMRNWLIPTMMEVLSKNTHVEYPQRVFEQGLISVNKKGKVVDYERIAVATANPDADYTEIRQVLDHLMRMFDVEYEINETEHDSFIPGRVGRVSVKGKDVAYIGEIAPGVLSNWEINMPVAVFELNLTELFEVINKK